MILTFSCKDTEMLYGGSCPDRFRAFRAQAERKLQMLDSANTIDDLRSPPGNRLERLSGNRLGRWSIRINNQWRICFHFENGNAYDVEIVDYH
ncbi:MAG: type II toxin-antitoxin system RelE/ParE family toxin [Nitrosomonas sp.]|jgi:proteic killer suppression protein|nr:type II toxin-antitoxin system RelE/ParE family toxin [Nitrosomonas sp.]MBK7365795.1 type II toxin-antitoxin system RelE/ParE family toxin [Nitrosomonas sp.]